MSIDDDPLYQNLKLRQELRDLELTNKTLSEQSLEQIARIHRLESVLKRYRSTYGQRAEDKP